MIIVKISDAYSIPQYEDEALVSTVKNIIIEGLNISSKHDSSLGDHLPLIFDLIESSDEPFYYKTGVKRSHRSRKHKCEGVIKIQPKIYSSEIMVTKKAGAVECFHVKDLEPLLYKPDLGFNYYGKVIK